MERKFKKGDLIREAKFDLFKHPTFDGSYLYSPYETVRTIDLSKNRIFLNKRVYLDGSEPVIISEQEANILLKKWQDIRNNIVIFNEFENEDFEFDLFNKTKL